LLLRWWVEGSGVVVDLGGLLRVRWWILREEVSITMGSKDSGCRFWELTSLAMLVEREVRVALGREKVLR